MRLAATLAVLAAAAAVAVAVVSAGDDAAPDVVRPAAPVWCPEGSRDLDARTLLGRTVDAARRHAEREGCQVRLVRRDGKNLPVTLDLNRSRVNVAAEDDVVVAVQGVY